MNWGKDDIDRGNPAAGCVWGVGVTLALVAFGALIAWLVRAW